MTKFTSYKCPVCKKIYKELDAYGKHMRTEHPGTIPEGWSDMRYTYMVHTGKSTRKCTECGKDTPWNEATGNYLRLCGDPACKAKVGDRFKSSMNKKYGKDTLIGDPDMQEKMLINRKISGRYKFRDGGEVAYMAKLEKQFLIMLDRFFNFPSADIMSPSPNRYIYQYYNQFDEEHTGEHTYIPDYFIPSANLEIELKSADNMRPSHLMIDVVRDACKDIHMIKDPSINYVKIYQNDYHVFFQVFSDIAQQNLTGEHRPIKYISRSLLTAVYQNYIPADYMAVLKEYIYKYSPKGVTMATKAALGDKMIAAESDMSDSYTEDILPEEEENPLTLDDQYLRTDNPENEENMDLDDSYSSRSIGLNPLIYYDLQEKYGDGSESDCALDFLSIGEPEAALEFFGFFGSKSSKKGGTIDERAADTYGSWKDKLFRNRLVGKATARVFSHVETVNHRIIIKGINCNLLLFRLKDKYSEAKLKYIFEYEYNKKSWNLYQKKKIGRGDMKIDYVYAPEFFCLELINLFTELANAYNDASYRNIAMMIYEQSWLSKSDREQVSPLSLEPLKEIRFTLLPYQSEFISLWPLLKNQLHMNGFILAFQAGKGKTITAIGLSVCLKAPHVYIICPNNLKDNWALEIKKYFSKYDDKALWEKDVCILGTQYGNPDTARFIITNNESIGLMQKIAHEDPDSLIILDESHNFRNYQGTRSSELFILADTIKSHNILCMSATPIKAAPAEIAPCLRLIDPTFTDEAAAMYSRCFDLSTTSAVGIVEQRFGSIIYRPDNATVKLPEKTVHEMKLKLPKDGMFALTAVHDEIITLFKDLHATWLTEVKPSVQDFKDSIRKYSSANRSSVDAYLRWVTESSNSLRGGDGSDFHELSVSEFRLFIEETVRSNSACPSLEADRLAKMEHDFVVAAKSHMGKAVGAILPKRREDMFIALYDANKETFYEKIRTRTKKTVIFSTMVKVIDHITKDLNDFGIKTVSITGGAKDRLSIITQFKEDPSTMVMTATSQSMGVGVTLIEASQMFFFGTPWRSTDFSQACDRIWRIGQTDAVDIATIRLDSAKKNLSDRMQDILDWSDRMFNAAIAPTQLTEEGEAAIESIGTPINTIDQVFKLYDSMENYQYGCLINGQIIDTSDVYEFFMNYHTLSVGEFTKYKGGVCWDYAMYQNWWLTKNLISSKNYFIEFDFKDSSTHTFTVIPYGDRFIYIERSFGKLKGAYIAEELDDIFNFVINAMIQEEDKMPAHTAVMVYEMTHMDKLVGLNTIDYLKRVVGTGKRCSFVRNSALHNLPELSRLEPAAMENMWIRDATIGPAQLESPEDIAEGLEKFNMDLDSRQYEFLQEDEVRTLSKIEDCFYRMASVNSANMPGLDFIFRFAKLFDKHGITAIPFLITMDGLKGFREKAVIGIPFKNGGLFPSLSLTKPGDNHLYYIDSVDELTSFVINQLYEIGSDSYNPDNDQSFVCTLSQLSHNANGYQTKKLQFHYDVYKRTLLKVEVMNYGWSANRF